MKQRLIVTLLLLATLLSAASGVGIYANGIEEDSVAGVEGISSVDLPLGTPYETALNSLPKTATLNIKNSMGTESQLLHTAGFSQGDWTLFNQSAITLSGGKIAINRSVANAKALTGGEYDNFVLEATLRGTANNPDNNFGVMFRAKDVTDKNADSYNGYYVGIGKNDGRYAFVVGYADGKWHMIYDTPIDYRPNTEYDLKVVVYENTMAAFLDGELMYKGNASLYDSGRVGIRTYHQLFECSALAVRTLSDADLADAEIVLSDKQQAELDAWHCDNYDADTAGGYLFETTVKGTDYKVTCTVNLIDEWEIDEEMMNLSYKNVSITDGFFKEYIKLMLCQVVPTAIANVEKSTGGMPNIINAAKMHRGESYSAFAGALYVDSDVHKVLESMCYALTIDAAGDADIEKAKADIAAKLEEWIPYFVDAQESSGYFDTYYTLQPQLNKFSDVDKHELYCMGHFMEAAVAHYECTNGDTRLLDVAVKCADYLGTVFGEGKRKQIPGHQEIELALLRLARTMLNLGEEYSVKAHKYADLAVYFLSVRGDHEGRDVEGKLPERYWQDHARVEDQTEAVGHAVRAQYMYTAMAEIASLDETYREKYQNALNSLWKDVTYTKQYVTGGVGQSAANEGFDDSYLLPNASAYCETCAGISNMMWNRSMSKLYVNSAYADQIETDLYNAVLGCVNLDGDKFYYHNSLAGSDMRNAWYGTACCPPNLTRTILSLGGYIYNYKSDALYVNQYIANKASVQLAGGEVSITMQSEMPGSGKGSIALHMEKNSEFTLYLRMPAWSDGVKIKVNGKAVAGDLKNENGYILLKDTWSNGDSIEFEFNMPVLFEETDEKVTGNIGCVSLRRGPIVYCAEEIDNSFGIKNAYVDVKSSVETVFVQCLDGKEDPYGVKDMYILKADGYVKGLSQNTPVTWTFVPFYARMNRGKNYMTVYVSKESKLTNLAQVAKPSASYTFSGDSPDNLNDGSDSKDARWTSWKDGEVLKDPYVQYDFEEAVKLKGCEIWWYDDNGGVRLADGFEIYYLNDESSDFVPVSHEDKYLCEHADGFITYLFEEVEATSIRIVIHNSKAAPGIVEWKLIGSFGLEEEEDEGSGSEVGEGSEIGEDSQIGAGEDSVTEEPEKENEENIKPEPEGENTQIEGENKNEKSSDGVSLWLVGGILAAAAALGAVLLLLFKKKKTA